MKYHIDDSTSITPTLSELQINRRRFFNIAVAAGGVALYSTLGRVGELQAGSHTEALLLSCMDYRLIDEVDKYMSKRGMLHKYDHVILAGAALGVLNDKFPSWGQTFWDHLEVAKKLHAISQVILLDHRDCGAYKVILGEDFSKDSAKERAAHTEQLKKLSQTIEQRYPGMTVELLLMNLCGEVEVIG